MASKHDHGSRDRNVLEWFVLGGASLIVAGVIGVLVYQLLVLVPTPPALRVEFDGASHRDDRYELGLTVHNDGTRTAEDVLVEVLLIRDADTDRAHVQFPFVPGKAVREGVVAFRTDPSTSTLLARVLGYRLP